MKASNSQARSDRPLVGSTVAAALLLGSPSFAPAQTERLPKVGYLGSAAQFANSFPKPG